MIINRTVAPAPLPVAEVKEHIKVMHDVEDGLVARYLAAAVRELDGPDGILGKCIGAQTWVAQMAGWDDVMVLPVEPVRSVAVAYDDADGQEQTLPADQYALEVGVGIRSRLRWTGGAKPALAAKAYPVRITIAAGYDTIPDDLIAAIWLRTGDLYEHREAQAVGAAISANPAWASLIARHRTYL